MSEYEPPPTTVYADIAPEVYDPDLDPDPYPDALRPPDDWLPDPPPPNPDGLGGVEPPDAAWTWHDARLIGVDRGAAAGADRFEIGAVNLYTDTNSGDLRGGYLPVAAFAEEGPAVGFYHALGRDLHAVGLEGDAILNLVEARAVEMGADAPAWQPARAAEFAAYAYLRDGETFDPALADEPPDEALALLVERAVHLGGALEPDAAFQALDAIGVGAENFDPSADPPPFYDTDTGIAYWIGVFQPDRTDRENCVTSILSLGHDPETGATEAQLAPCVPGSWDKTYAAAEYLIDVAGRGGIEAVFDTAEGMALATDQRALWANERGVPLAADAEDWAVAR